MNEIKELFAAYIKFPEESGEVEFEYSVMEINKVYPDMIETKHFYFTSRNYSTRYFEKSMLNKEYEISYELTVFYSESKEDCLKWLTDKRNLLLQIYKNKYERLKNSEIKENIYEFD